VRNRIGRHVEIVRAIDNLPRHAVIHRADAHGFLKILAEVEKCDREVTRPFGSQCRLDAEFDLSMRRVVDLPGNVGRRARRRNIGRRRKCARALLEHVEREGLRRPELQYRRGMRRYRLSRH
jgi:hypothetical protein